jgi:hypothetical protein
VVVLIVLAIVVAACGGPGPTPDGTATVSPAALSPSPPASAAPSASSTVVPADAVYDEIEAQVSALRGLDKLAPVARGVLDEQGLKDFVTRAFAEDNPADYVANSERLLEGLGLLPVDASLQDLFVEMLGSQVVGLYDDTTRTMYVVSETGTIGPLEKITYAHEFDHALQDQHFGLGELRGSELDEGDRTLARTALAEGDGSLLMVYWAQQHLTAQELAAVAGATDPASEEVLARMPAILRETLLFPYTAGLTALLPLQLGSGWPAVDALWADPPDSTEQIIHADKLAAREAPVAVELPDDLASQLGPGWSIAMQDRLGELQLSVWLREVGGTTTATAAAAGWGGDRVALVSGPSGAWGIVLDTAWDTVADAGEFAAAADGAVAIRRLAGVAAVALTPAPERVVVLLADDDGTLGRLASVLGLAG